MKNNIMPVPVKKDKITIGNKYYTCSWNGVICVTVLKFIDDIDGVLVKCGNKRTSKNGRKIKPFVRNVSYIFGDELMAKAAGKQWEHDERKRRKNKSE